MLRVNEAIQSFSPCVQILILLLKVLLDDVIEARGLHLAGEEVDLDVALHHFEGVVEHLWVTLHDLDNLVSYHL